ncbi:MAG: hypothetical protein HYW48_05220 [Deltaproteobacteria bacterium]|nr:hypothetical protein [Deltaproteobacteria bacterium]
MNTHSSVGTVKVLFMCSAFILPLSCKTTKDAKTVLEEKQTLAAQKIDEIVAPKLDAIFEKLQAFLVEQTEKMKDKTKPFAEHPLFAKFSKYFPQEQDLLNQVRYAEVDELPHWGPPEKIGIDSDLLTSIGLQPGIFDFPGALAITFDKTIFVKKGNLENEDMFFHELVHVAQYNVLGNKDFMLRYLRDVFRGTPYEGIKLEQMAYSLEQYYKSTTFDVLAYVREYQADL